MNAQAETIDSWLRPRAAQKHKRARTHRSFGPAFNATAAVPSATLDTSHLGMREPESSRHAMISGSISLAAHGAVVAGLALSAWYAPDIVDVIVPVRIIKDTTPVAEPAPARRVVVPKRTIAARSRVPTRVAQTTPIAPPQVQQLTQRAPQVASIDTTAAPTQLQQRTITSQRVVHQRTLVATNPSAVSVAQFKAATVAPTEMNAPRVDVTGPRQIVPVTPVNVTAPQAFTDYQATPTADYTERASATSKSVTVATGQSGIELDATTAFALEGNGGVSGGRGTAASGIPCAQRESVNNYVNEMGDRVKEEWRRFDVPSDTPANATVILAFTLDESGTPSDIELRSAPTPYLGDSCRRALLAASPFPAMHGNVRCLAGTRRKVTFRVPVVGAPPQ